MDDVTKIRDRIDELDQEVVRLLKNRYENARLLGRIKQRRQLDYRDPEREKVKLSGREINKTRTAAKEMEVEPGTIWDAASSDMVILSVAMEETVRVATETASLMATGSLLIDISSVKTGISDRINEKIPKG